MMRKIKISFIGKFNNEILQIVFISRSVKYGHKFEGISQLLK
jgi:hypothetical protein